VPEQVGADDFCKDDDDAPAKGDSETADSEKDTADGPTDGPEEASENDDLAAGP
jgi:hypothetical protein